MFYSTIIKEFLSYAALFRRPQDSKNAKQQRLMIYNTSARIISNSELINYRNPHYGAEFG